MTSRVFIGKAKALHVAGVGGLPELATRHHPAEMEAVVAQWLAGDRDAVCFNPFALDAIPTSEAHRIICVALDPYADTDRVVMKPLCEHPEWGQWDDVLQPGGIWTLVFESWVVS